MLNKLISHLWSLRHQFIKYFIIGISAVFLDIGSLFLLKQYANFTPVMAIVVNQLFLIVYVFFFNKYWSFKAQGVTHKQAIRFLIVAAFNFFFSIAWMYVFNGKFGLNYLLVRTANIALAVAWNFALYRYWVYNYPQEIQAPPGP